MRAWMRYGLTILLSCLTCSETLLACTDIRVTAKDGTVLIARSMEFALDLQSNLMSSNRGRLFSAASPTGAAGLTWQGKFGYVFLNGLNIDMAVDGMNEKGLSFGALYLPSFASYQSVPVGGEKQALPYYNLGDWILSNFESVEQVKNAIGKIYVYASPIPGMGDTIFPLHFSVYDAQGRGLVIEYVGGKLKMYDNTVGVLTNSPTYDWHLTNLNNYVHLTPKNPHPVVDNGITFAATGQGFGMIGLPGDISPPSRFVKMTTLLNVATQPLDAAGAINLSEHLMNNVDIPNGLAREDDGNKVTTESTEWVVFKDLTHRVFYFRTYTNLALRGVVLDKINFEGNAPRLKMPIATPPMIQDMTMNFNGATIR
ncbi:MAG: choloylglycine hydrolase family protein [Gammaproteobacteria bacterium]|nr:choloylglycine hydrolase family protein [Gammaproteobacteria bacterium]